MSNSCEKVVYIYSENLENECNRLPTMLQRASIVQDLINSYKLLENKNVIVVKNEEATEDELKLFHSTAYVDFLKKVNDLEDYSEFEAEQLEFGLAYDCPILRQIYDFVRCMAGGTLTAAKILAAKKCKLAINWFGGWHHAQRDEAEGFCYVNDIVIGIQKLSETFNKILYLDLDIHHGNGVQNAFELSNRILTLSFHKFFPGFYPGTGSIEEIGKQKGKYYTINVPLLQGINHGNYLKLFNKIFHEVVKSFNPQCLVVQCGADGLSGDSVGECNLTLETFGECVRKVLECDLPTMFLGGGGYNFANAARLWTYLTSVILNQDLDDDIPDSCEFFTKYSPTYELHIDQTLQKDCNNDEHINNLISVISGYCDFIS